MPDDYLDISNVCQPFFLLKTVVTICVFTNFYALQDVHFDHAKKLQFMRQVEDLTGRLTKIVKDTVQVQHVTTCSVPSELSLNKYSLQCYRSKNRYKKLCRKPILR